MKIFQFCCAVLLSTQLAACGGGGGSATSAQAPITVPVTPPVANPVPNPAPVVDPTPGPVTTPVAGPSILFVGDSGNKVIAAFDVLAPTGPGTVIAKLLTSDFSLINGGKLDAPRDLLYVSAFTEVAVFSKASTLTGKIVPARTFTPKLSTDAYIANTLLDAANDRVYIAFRGRDSGIAVYDHASTLQGAVTPNRVITGTFDTYNFTIDFKRGILYSKSSLNDPIRVFDNVDKASGALTPARSIKLDGNIVALSIDADRDILFAMVQNAGVTSTGNASTISSNLPLPRSVISMSVITGNAIVSVDPRNDRLYIYTDGGAYIINEASRLPLLGRSSILSLSVGSGANFNITGFGF